MKRLFFPLTTGGPDKFPVGLRPPYADLVLDLEVAQDAVDLGLHCE
jgi:hypothetical protein